MLVKLEKDQHGARAKVRRGRPRRQSPRPTSKSDEQTRTPPRDIPRALLVEGSDDMNAIAQLAPRHHPRLDPAAWFDFPASTAPTPKAPKPS
ncbi:MAG: hypothetical protein R3F65_19180 [bacterium]